MFGHLEGVRYGVAGTWVRAAAPALIGFYFMFRERIFETATLPHTPGGSPAQHLQSHVPSTPAHTGTYGPIVTPGGMLLTVTGGDNAFAAANAAVETRWARHDRAATSTAAAVRHAQQAVAAVSLQQVVVNGSSAAAAVTVIEDAAVSAAAPHLMFGVDAALVAAAERDAAVASGTILKDASITLGILAAGVVLVVLATQSGGGGGGGDTAAAVAGSARAR